MRTPRPIARLLTVRDVAELVQSKESTVRAWIKARSLRAIKFGREWRISPDDLKAFLDAHANMPRDDAADEE